MKINQLTFTRFIAAISIVIYHYGTKSNLFNNNPASFLFKQANIGVTYFFILSGFVMIIAYNSNSAIRFWSYLKNRLARIYPVYFLAIFLNLGLAVFSIKNIGDVVLNILMLQAWFPAKALTVNYPGWSLSVELFFYLLFPILFNLLYKKLSLKINFIWIIAFWLISQLIFHMVVQFKVLNLPLYSTKDILYLPIMHLNEFLIGNLAGLFFVNKLRTKTGNYSVHITVTIATFILLLRFPFGLHYHNGLLAVIFVPLIIFLSLSTDKITGFFSKNIFVFLGEISFGIYILQGPVWTIISDARLKKLFNIDKINDFTLAFFIRLLILILVSAISYLYFEKPIRNYIKNKGKDKK